MKKLSCSIDARKDAFQTSICKAAKLKQCPMCRIVMKSVCGKSKCVVDKRLIMILPKCLSIKRTATKNLFRKSNNKEDSIEDSESNRFHY